MADPDTESRFWSSGNRLDSNARFPGYGVKPFLQVKVDRSVGLAIAFMLFTPPPYLQALHADLTLDLQGR